MNENIDDSLEFFQNESKVNRSSVNSKGPGLNTKQSVNSSRDFGGEIDHEKTSRASGSSNRQSLSFKPEMPKNNMEESEYDAQFSDEDDELD